MSGSLCNRVRQPNRVVGGAVHYGASLSASERIGDWVFGGGAVDTDRRSFEASRPHASRGQQHPARAKLPGERGPATSRGHQASAEQGARARARAARARHTGGGDSNRLCEVNSHLTRSHYQYTFISTVCNI